MKMKIMNPMKRSPCIGHELETIKDIETEKPDMGELCSKCGSKYYYLVQGVMFCPDCGYSEND